MAFPPDANGDHIDGLLHRSRVLYANSKRQKVDRDAEVAAYPDPWRPAYQTFQDHDRAAGSSYGVSPASDTGGMNVVDEKWQPLGELVITLVAAEHPYERPRLALSLRLPGE